MPIFRTFGVGETPKDAYENAKYYESKNHEDLSQTLNKIKVTLMKPNQNIRSDDLELKFIFATHAINCEKKRSLTKAEKKAKEWIYNTFKDNSDKYLECYNYINTPKGSNNKCLMVKLNGNEEKEWRDRYCCKKNGNIYRFIGTADYILNSDDDY